MGDGDLAETAGKTKSDATGVMDNNINASKMLQSQKGETEQLLSFNKEIKTSPCYEVVFFRQLFCKEGLLIRSLHAESIKTQS